MQKQLGAREVFRRNIKRLMREKGVDQARIVSALSVTASTVSDWVNGKKYPRVEAMQRLADFLECSLFDLTMDPQQENRRLTIHEDIVPIVSNRVPLLGAIQCGAPTFAEENFEGYVEAGAQIKADFALRARGDSMIGIGIQDGSIVFIRKQSAVNNGDVAAVILDEEATLKRVRYLPGGMTMLQAENPRYAPIIIGGEGETRVVQVLGKAVAYMGAVL